MMAMTKTDVARIQRLHGALTHRRSVLVSELTEAQKRFDRMKQQASRDPALSGDDAQKTQLTRIAELQRQLAEHDQKAAAKLKVRTAGVQS